jgi:hypothetical protein
VGEAGAFLDTQTHRWGGRKDIEAVRKMILETDPRKPSTRIVQFTDEAAASVAHNRDCDVDSLVQTLSKDLDRVVIKCLEKDRNRRDMPRWLS